jgi:hypothetical protein
MGRDPDHHRLRDTRTDHGRNGRLFGVGSFWCQDKVSVIVSDQNTIMDLKRILDSKM